VGGEDRLFHFAAERLVARQEALPGELLRDRAAALRAAAQLDVANRCSGDTDQIDAAMFVETLDLDRNDRLPEVR
jgi:hypothetical protein